jgi:transketolase
MAPHQHDHQAETPNAQLDRVCVNTIRTLAMDAVQQANSGHPGMPMGAAAMAYVLWTRFLKHNPADPAWPNRDRFVLSAGHGSMLLYSLLHLTGYDLSLEELKRFRQLGSRTPGHPEHGVTPGVEVTTGPLGQGFGVGVGLAIAERYLAARYNRPGHSVFDHYVYSIVSDGDLMEGIASEAASLAGHLQLGKLVYLYDDNHVTIDGSTGLSFTEDVARRFEAYDWHVQRVDGDDLGAVAAALSAARAELTRPSLICARTHIGHGSPNKQDSSAAHGAPLGADEVSLTKQALGWPVEPPFYVPAEALAHFREAVERGRTWEEDWRARFAAYQQEHAELAAELETVWAGKLPADWQAKLPTFSPADGATATRVASGKVLNAVAPFIPTLVGGSADLAGSNDTTLKGPSFFDAEHPDGRNFHFGVREHAMGAILNGLALHGELRPYGGTFLIFSDYMRPAIRLAALMELPVVYVFTHDSIGLGEDGPTHQPVEHLAALRAIPNLLVVRPADASEVAVAWRVALESRMAPVALVLTRQSLPILDRRELAPADGLARGAYVLADAPDARPEAILIATGSEVALALEARKLLAAQGVSARVVSMPSWELFEAQPAEYRESVLPATVPARLAVEAGVAQGWDRYVGPAGGVFGMTTFGASAPAKALFEEFGFTPANVAARALALLGKG